MAWLTKADLDDAKMLQNIPYLLNNVLNYQLALNLLQISC